MRLRASCSDLTTSILGADEYPAEKVLRDYKEQTATELQLEVIKGPEFVATVFVKKPERLEAPAYVVLPATIVRAIILSRVRRYAEAKDEEMPIPGEFMTRRPTARMLKDSFGAVTVVILCGGTRLLSQSEIFLDKMFRALVVSPAVCVTVPCETRDPQDSAVESEGVPKMHWVWLGLTA